MGFDPSLKFPTNPYGGANQYGSFPMAPYPLMQPGQSYGTGTPPGIVPPSGTGSGVGTTFNPGWTKIGGGMFTGGTIDQPLTQSMGEYLQSQLGMGVTPFNLSALLPSTGQATAPGTLTAPENPLMQSLQQYFLGQGGGPNSFILPMWQSMMQAMEQPQQQDVANLREQFASQGALGSSEYGTALANYLNQATLNKQSLLGQLSLQGLSPMMQQATTTQALDQEAIQNLYNEFVRTQPQSNPLLPYQFGMSTTFPPIYSPKGGIGSAVVGSIGNILGSAGGAMQAAGATSGTMGTIASILAALGGL